MNLTAQVKLLPDVDQVQLLKQTMMYFNDACNYVSKVAFQRKIYHHIALQKILIHDTTLYYHLRAKYPTLNAMQIQLVCDKVADAYKPRLARIKKTKRKLKKPCTFRETSSIPYNQRISNYQLLVKCNGDKHQLPVLSLSVINGVDNSRAKIDYTLGDHQRKIFMNAVPNHFGRESRLSYKKGTFYLNIPVEQCVALEPVLPRQHIGVDLGVSNIATTSYGKIYNGDMIENKRLKFQKHRSSLQKCGTKSAKRRLKLTSGKEQRFRKNINHVISKELVATAKGTNSGIVLEDLTHIREQTTVRRKQRARHHGWSFAQLREFVMYKALMEGVTITVVDPKYTSQRCSVCGHIERSNRTNQYRFHCKQCNHDAHADYNAACNLAWLGNSGVSSFSKTEATLH